ncbi:MAG TPA: hypothetical protein VFB21_14455 [Chthonomonadaceae bacterium]|nr:hypothetical protein [Chthonomonadaceae bacterium]
MIPGKYVSANSSSSSQHSSLWIVGAGIIGGLLGSLMLIVSPKFIGEQPFRNFFHSIGAYHWGLGSHIGFLVLVIFAGIVTDLKSWKGGHRAGASVIALLIWGVVFLIFKNQFAPFIRDNTSDIAATRIALFSPAAAWAAANLLAAILK